MSRPTDYNDKKAIEICNEVAIGKSLRKISLMESMPCTSTMLTWLRDIPEFLLLYEQSKIEMTVLMSEEIIDIADDKTSDYIETEDEEGNVVERKLNNENIQRSRLRVDSRKWLLSKLMPKKYGDKLEVDNTIKGKIELYAHMSDQELELKLDELTLKREQEKLALIAQEQLENEGEENE